MNCWITGLEATRVQSTKMHKDSRAELKAKWQCVNEFAVTTDVTT